jgi:hypothetical protein
MEFNMEVWGRRRDTNDHAVALLCACTSRVGNGAALVTVHSKAGCVWDC